MQLKYGIYADYGAHKDTLKDLVLFASSNGEHPTTLAEYVSRMKEDQKAIYYACGESAARIALLPQAEAVRDKGYEILYLTDNVDEFALKMLMQYDEKPFQNVSADDLDLRSEEEKKDAEKQAADNKDLLNFLTEGAGREGKKRLSFPTVLKSHPVCLSSEGAISLEMEKVLNAMPSGDKVQAQRVLELNAAHPVFQKLTKLFAEDKDTLKEYAALLYDQALLIEGIPVEDPVAFSNRICTLMAE